MGGENKGARPMETVLAGLGGCSAIDVMNILKKSASKDKFKRVKRKVENSAYFQMTYPETPDKNFETGTL